MVRLIRQIHILPALKLPLTLCGACSHVLRAVETSLTLPARPGCVCSGFPLPPIARLVPPSRQSNHVLPGHHVNALLSLPVPFPPSVRAVPPHVSPGSVGTIAPLLCISPGHCINLCCPEMFACMPLLLHTFRLLRPMFTVCCPCSAPPRSYLI